MLERAAGLTDTLVCFGAAAAAAAREGAVDQAEAGVWRGTRAVGRFVSLMALFKEDSFFCTSIRSRVATRSSPHTILRTEPCMSPSCTPLRFTPAVWSCVSAAERELRSPHMYRLTLVVVAAGVGGSWVAPECFDALFFCTGSYILSSSFFRASAFFFSISFCLSTNSPLCVSIL